MPGRIHNVWLLWEFLLDANDFAALREQFATCRSTAAYLIGAADPVRAEVFEWHPVRPCMEAPHDAGLLAAANHFISPDWVNTPLAEACGAASSLNRRANLLRCAREYLDRGQKIGLPELCAIMEKTVAEGGAKVNGTLFQIIAASREQTWYVKLKNQPDWSEIRLANLLKGTGELA